MNIHDLYRRIENLIRLGTISEIDESHQKVRVKTGGLVTDWLPVPATVTHNATYWQPVRLGTQVVLGGISGDPSQSVIIGLLHSDTVPAISDNPALDIVQFNDGTRIEYNSQSAELRIECTGDITVNADGDAKVIAQGKAELSAQQSATVSGSSVILNDDKGGGVVCQNHLCAFTGAPHPEASSTVSGAK